MKQVHGHEVLHMMLESGKSYSRAELVSDIIARFGADTRFHTCSAEDLTAQGLVDFLDSKGKFIPREDGGINTAEEKICKHP